MNIDGMMISIVSVTVLIALWYVLKYIEELKVQVEASNWKIDKLTHELYNMRTCIGEYMDTFMYVGIEELRDREENEESEENNNNNNNNEEEVKSDELQLG